MLYTPNDDAVGNSLEPYGYEGWQDAEDDPTFAADAAMFDEEPEDD